MKQTNSITKYAALTALVVMAASSIGCDKIQLPNGDNIFLAINVFVINNNE